MTHGEARERRRLMVQDYLAGRTTQEIGGLHGVTRQWVRHVLLKGDVKLRPRGPRRRVLPDYLVEEVLARWDAGEMVRRIALDMGLRVKLVSRTLHDNNRHPRTGQRPTTVRTMDGRVECRCARCREWKPGDGFVRKKNRDGGFGGHGYCIECAREAAKEYGRRKRMEAR